MPVWTSLSRVLVLVRTAGHAGAGLLVCVPAAGQGGLSELGAVDTLGPWGAHLHQLHSLRVPPPPPWPGLGAQTSAPWRYSPGGHRVPHHCELTGAAGVRGV